MTSSQSGSKFEFKDSYSAFPRVSKSLTEEEKKKNQESMNRKSASFDHVLDEVKNQEDSIPNFAPQSRKHYPFHLVTYYQFRYNELYKVGHFANTELEKDSTISINFSAKPQVNQRVALAVRKTGDDERDRLKLKQLCSRLEQRFPPAGIKSILISN